jgi:hypothetical protein
MANSTNKHAYKPPNVGAGHQDSRRPLPPVPQVRQMERERGQPAKVKPQGVRLPGGHVGFAPKKLKRP